MTYAGLESFMPAASERALNVGGHALNTMASLDLSQQQWVEAAGIAFVTLSLLGAGFMAWREHRKRGNQPPRTPNVPRHYH